MADFKPHPSDTQELALQEATKALVRANPTNRYYMFPMIDRYEIAFGNARHLTGLDGLQSFELTYHSAISMDEAMMRDLHHSLSALINALDATNG